MRKPKPRPTVKHEDLGAELGEIERVFMLASLAVKRGRSLARRARIEEAREELRFAEEFGFRALERLMEARLYGSRLRRQSRRDQP